MTMRNFSHIKDYFRQERIAFRERPILWLLRILFVALILYSGCSQWCFMTIAQAFSIGFTYSTEAERIIPFTDTELKARRFTRVNMVWLRYLILGLTSYALGFIFKTPFVLPEVILKRPYMYIAFFILQMTFIYYNFLDQVIEKKKGKAFKSMPKVLYITNMFSMITCFVYAIEVMKSPNSGFFNNVGIEWIHVAIILAAALLLIINCFRIYKNWKFLDFESDKEKIQRAKGGMA